MATSKKLKMEDIRAHLFISVIGNHVDIVYHDDLDNGAGLGAALASAMEEDDKLFGIFSAALLTAIESKEKYSSKTAKKPVKKATKSVKKK
jgi:hypothetical protein